MYIYTAQDLTFIKKFIIIYIENNNNKEIYMLSYYDNIIKALQNGTTEEEIARQFTKDLNAARDDFHGKAMYDLLKSYHQSVSDT